MDTLTQEKLREELKYDPDTGLFWWLKRSPGRVLRRPAGGIQKDGYRYIRIEGRQRKAARLAVLYMTGRWPIEVDHKDRNRGNDRWLNLLECTRKENSKNLSLRPENTSGIRGVTWCSRRNKWQVKIGLNGKQIYLGRYKTLTAAKKARELAEAGLYL